jgi:predicted phosphodiesterase
VKIAVTADLHLTTRKEHPGRFEVLEDILRQCGELAIDWLVIAGDLFDQSPHNLADFEAAYAKAHPSGLPVTVIPGNHDAGLKPGSLAADGLEIVAEPTRRPIGDDSSVLLVPYRAGTTLGEHLARFQDELVPGAWALISHADWLGGLRSANPAEPGVYMPMNRADLQTYQPAVALLGHIHIPLQDPPIYYAGSPLPLNVTETGMRRFLIFDTEDQTVQSQPVNSPVVYFDETVVMLPVEGESAYLEGELDKRIQAWGIPDGWHDRVQVRLRVAGYASNREAARQVAEQCLEEFEFYEGSPDLSGLEVTDDPDRIHIARQVREWIDELDWPDDPAEPDKAEILREALAVIYRG